VADETAGFILSPIIMGCTVQEHWSWNRLVILALIHKGNRQMLPRVVGLGKAVLDPINASGKTSHASEGSSKESE